MNYTCPVCYYDKLDESPYDETGFGSFNICPQCGTEFGVAAVNAFLGVDGNGLGAVCQGAPQSFLDAFHVEARAEWISGGSKWWSNYRSKPDE